MGKTRKFVRWSFVLLAVTAFSLWHYLLTHAPAKTFQVSPLDLEKGSAEYVRAPNGGQMVVGSAPMGALPDPLKKVQPSGNSEIDVLVITGTIAAAYGGFIDLLKNYNVGIVIEPAFSSKAKTYAELQSLIAQKHIPTIRVQNSIEIKLDPRQSSSYAISCPTPAKVNSKYVCSIKSNIQK